MEAACARAPFDHLMAASRDRFTPYCAIATHRINALSFISGIIAIANHGASKPSLLEEKISLVFGEWTRRCHAVICIGISLTLTRLVSTTDAFDFDGTGNMTMDELTILFLSSLRALVVITGQGTEPSDDECEQISIKAFNFVGRQLSSPITRDEFVRYVTFTVGSDCEDLETALIGFGLLDIPSMPEPQIEIYAAISYAHPDFTAKISNEAQVPPPDDDMSASLTHHAAEATLSNPMTPRETNLNFSPSAEAPCAAAPTATDAPATAEAPTAADAPATAEAPATSEAPATAEAPTAAEAPAAAGTLDEATVPFPIAGD